MDKNAQDHESKKKITSINDITQLLFDQIWGKSAVYRRYAPDTKNLEMRPDVKVKVTQNGMLLTQPSQDVSIHQIWDSYLK